MRLSDLLHEPVYDSEWRPIGRVQDVRLVQDGPLQGLTGAAFRVDGLVVGRSAMGVRLGFLRREMHGPWPLKVLFERLERRVKSLPWSQVEDWGTDGVRASVPLAELGPPPPVS